MVVAIVFLNWYNWSIPVFLQSALLLLQDSNHWCSQLFGVFRIHIHYCLHVLDFYWLVAHIMIDCAINFVITKSWYTHTTVLILFVFYNFRHHRFHWLFLVCMENLFYCQNRLVMQQQPRFVTPIATFFLTLNLSRHFSFYDLTFS